MIGKHSRAKYVVPGISSERDICYSLGDHYLMTPKHEEAKVFHSKRDAEREADRINRFRVLHGRVFFAAPATFYFH